MIGGRVFDLTAPGQGWDQVVELLLAFVLSSVIGLERQVRGKSAGLRTQAIVGTSAALIMLVSKYGFSDVLADGRVSLDPSRIAAQIVSGIGFLGAGIILTRRGAIRGLTTAASVWETAAIGMAAGAGLPLLALVVTGLHFVIVLGYTPLVRYLPGADRDTRRVLVTYHDEEGVLRRLLHTCTEQGWTITELATAEARSELGLGAITGGDGEPSAPRVVSVVVALSGAGLQRATARMAEVEGVSQVEFVGDDEGE